MIRNQGPGGSEHPKQGLSCLKADGQGIREEARNWGMGIVGEEGTVPSLDCSELQLLNKPKNLLR
jgi:hypothetical protein